jgi:membrane fusion protein (multidrug efflux system)
MKKNRKLLLIAVFSVLLVGAAGTGFYFIQAASGAADEAAETPEKSENGEALEASGEEAEDEKPPVPVNVSDVQIGSVSTYLTATANLVPEDEVKVLAEAEGRVTDLLVEEGDHVQRGQLLATLLRNEAEIRFNKAELKTTNAALAYERAAKMAAEDLISREEFDKITMDDRIAQQELAEARWQLDKTEIRAPFDGRLTLRSVTLGQHVRPGDELFVVTDFDPLIARIYLPEKDVLALEEGRQVKITLKANDSVRFSGRIRQISPVVDTATGTVKITVAAIDPPPAVRPGGFVTIDITRETRESALLVPRKAVIRELNQAHVFVTQNDVAVRRDVSLGLEEGDLLEILAGVESGERVIVAGHGSLKDGSPVKVLPQPTEQASELSEPSQRQRRG